MTTLESEDTICNGCIFYKVLNPHEILNGQPVKHCSSGLRPEKKRNIEYCSGRKTKEENNGS